VVDVKEPALFWAAAIIVKSRNMAQKVNFIGSYSSRRRRTDAPTTFAEMGASSYTSHH